MKILDKKISLTWIIILCAIGIIVGLSIVAAIATNSYSVPQTGTIPTPTPSPTPTPTLAVSITIDGNAWTNGTTINWGSNLVPGQASTKAISFTNTGNTPITSISIVDDATSHLPSGWTETISNLVGTLGAGQVASGIITLTPSASATPGTYGWTSYITTQPQA
jgi:hypothetical protein